MFVILNRKTLATLPVDMAHAAGVIVGVVVHCVSAANSAHEPTHLTIHQRPQNQMIVIGHQLVRVKFHIVNLQTFKQNLFESRKVRFRLKNVRSQIATIQSVVQSSGFISAW